jgi:hypothetical protein
MTKKIFIAGSVQYANLYSYCTRAEQLATYNEGTQAQAIVDHLITELKLYDVEIVRTVKGMDLNASAKMANDTGCTSYYAIHTNAGGGQGTVALKQTSLFVSSANRAKSAIMATTLTNTIAGLGRHNRGTYGKLNTWRGEWFSDLRQPKMPSTILEIEFHDWADGAAWIINNKVLIGKTIATAIAQIEGLSKKVVQTAYRVQVTASALNIRTGPGVNYAICAAPITDKGVYTIVETRNGWGRLKSGAGWISLAYCRKA